MVMELIKDNRKIVDRITTEHIDKFVELLRRDKVFNIVYDELPCNDLLREDIIYIMLIMI